ncbi:hypothetical protein [Bdellovibrio sp. HCB288]|uniref:hypothetical protein n=1 Tax=Bdellovibrio sp. HCB288 TaxID=3394355 RepID=UPI0039B55D69
MANLRTKTVELLCALVTIAAPLPSFAQTTTNVDISQALANWRRQEAVSVVAEKKRISTLNPKQTPPKQALSSLSGPGLDGGGGVGVLNSNGQLRLLDLAVTDSAPIVRFHKDSYLDILTSKGPLVSNKGTFVTNKEFFACAVKKLSRQDNVFLQYLKPENIKLVVVMTDLPLNLSSLHLTKIVFPSPSGAGSVWEMTQLPSSNLFSTTLPVDYQRPIASYAIQPTIKGSVPRQTLLVSSQMYQALSDQDQCALQIHELLRFISNAGNSVPLLLKTPLKTSYIEHLTRRIMAERPVYVGDIPATNFFKYLAVNGSDKFAPGAIQQIAVNIYDPFDDSRVTARKAEFLYYQMEDAIKTQEAYEEYLMQFATNHPALKNVWYSQEKMELGEYFDLRDLVH